MKSLVELCMKTISDNQIKIILVTRAESTSQVFRKHINFRNIEIWSCSNRSYPKKVSLWTSCIRIVVKDMKSNLQSFSKKRILRNPKYDKENIRKKNLELLKNLRNSDRFDELQKLHLKWNQAGKHILNNLMLVADNFNANTDFSGIFFESQS